MGQENEELEMQNTSNSVFDNFANEIEEHPKETGFGIQDYKDLSEENEYLKKLNNSLCDALVESNEGGGLNHDG